MKLLPYPYLQLATELKREIAMSNSKPGDIFQSARVIIEKYNVSHVTARKAINVLIDEGILEREPGCKPRLLHLPELSSEFLMSPQEGFNIAIMASCSVMEPVQSFQNYVYRKIIDSVRNRNWNPLTSLVMRVSEIDDLVKKIIDSGFVNGVIVSCLCYESVARYFEKIRFPAVFLDFSPKTALVDSVTVNNRLSALQAIRALTDLGHRRIDFVGHLRKLDAIDDDARELRDAWADLREELGFAGQAHLTEPNIANASFDEIAENIIEAQCRPTALLISNPDIAQRIKRAIYALSPTIADELSYVCIGGEYLEPFSLSYVSQNWEDAAESALDQLAVRINGGSQPGKRTSCVGEYIDHGSVRNQRMVGNAEVKATTSDALKRE